MVHTDTHTHFTGINRLHMRPFSVSLVCFNLDCCLLSTVGCCERLLNIIKLYSHVALLTPD